MTHINTFTAVNPETKEGYIRTVLYKEKYEPVRRPASYYLYVDQIEISDQPLEISVGRQFYEEVNQGDTFIVWVNSGIFEIPIVVELTPWNG